MLLLTLPIVVLVSDVYYAPVLMDFSTLENFSLDSLYKTVVINGPDICRLFEVMIIIAS